MKPYAKMLIALVAMIATALVLQGAFDASDHQKSERIVRNYRGGGTESIEDKVQKIAPGGAWSSEITQGCRGFVRVTYAAPGGRWDFDYDVPQHYIHPANAAAEQILSSIPVAADGGAPR